MPQKEASNPKVNRIPSPVKPVNIESIWVSLTLDTRHLSNKTEECPVVVRVHYKGRKYLYPTGYKCTLEKWKKLSAQTGTGAQSKTKLWEDKGEQERIFNKVLDIVKDLNSKGLFTFDTLKANLTGKGSDTFLGIWDNIINSSKLNTGVNYRHSYKSLVRNCFNLIKK